MKRYKKNRKCPKCRHKKTVDSYRDKSSIPSSMESVIEATTPDERIIRKCKNCEYVWAESPADYKYLGEPIL